MKNRALVIFWHPVYHILTFCLPVLRSAKRGPSNVRRLNNIFDVIFYCSVGERLRALALLNTAQVIFWLSVYRSYSDVPDCLLPAHPAFPGTEVSVWQFSTDHRWRRVTEEDVLGDLGYSPDSGLSVCPQSPCPSRARPGVSARGGFFCVECAIFSLWNIVITVFIF